MGDLLYVQNDGKIFVKSDHPEFEQCRNLLLGFSTLIERQDPVLVYQITGPTLWQASSLGDTARNILDFLRQNCSLPVPFDVQQQIVREMKKWGVFRLLGVSPGTVQLSFSESWHDVIWQIPVIKEWALQHYRNRIVFAAEFQGPVKQVLAQHGYPVLDEVGYEPSPSVDIQLKGTTKLRDYQRLAVTSFFKESFHQSGVILMPCGSGKTIVGLAILCQLSLHTLIVTPSDSAAQQWIDECLRRTTLDEELIGMYRPGNATKPITITTYQRIAGRNQKGVRRHLQVLTSHPWGLVIYDEVHVLPAPLFRLAAELQSSRRLGLTATLVREDEAETDVFSLIGSKCYDADWKQLEQQGYLAAVNCIELRVKLPAKEIEEYNRASPRHRHRIAASNPQKLDVVSRLLNKHKTDSILIIGHYLDSLIQIAKRFHLPLVTGETPVRERLRIYQAFRDEEIRCVVLSRVANMAIDLPQATVGIQISGLFGSRQEEAQRLGRLLRPKEAGAVFYSLVTANSVEVETARRRQRFLVEHGYSYEMQTIDTERVTEC